MSELVAPGGRPFKRSRSPADMQFVNGVFEKTEYRGVRMLKSPLDIVIYMQLISRLRPQTIIEIGSHSGGSALWYADMIRTRSPEARVISIDRKKPPPTVRDKRVTFLKGNALRLGEVLSDELLASLPRPWLVTEDSAHFYETSIAVLDFFDPHLQAGDYVVVEDGAVEELTGNFHIANGPNQAVHEFLSRTEGRYEIDAEMCDFFGYNVTENPNGYLRRIR